MAENCLYQFVETVLTDMTKKEALKKVSDQIIDCWSQSTSFMDVLISRALAYS